MATIRNAHFLHPPQQASADRGVYSPDNEQFAQKMGVQCVILPKPGISPNNAKHLNAASGLSAGVSGMQVWKAASVF